MISSHLLRDTKTEKITVQKYQVQGFQQKEDTEEVAVRTMALLLEDRIPEARAWVYFYSVPGTCGDSQEMFVGQVNVDDVVGPIM